MLTLQQNVFPDRGTVYDHYFVKQASGSWGSWIDMIDRGKLSIPKDAKVCLYWYFVNKSWNLLTVHSFCFSSGFHCYSTKAMSDLKLSLCKTNWGQQRSSLTFLLFV